MRLIYALVVALATFTTPALAWDNWNFTLEPRLDIDWAAVPVFKAKAPNTSTVLDVMPNGNPRTHGIGGKAWVHVCDKDHALNQPMVCAIVAATDGKVRFGVTDHNGATPGFIEWVVGNKVVGKMTGTKFIIGPFDTAAVLRRLDAKDRQIAALQDALTLQRNRLLFLSARLDDLERRLK
jgi:hypothetical protein